jgi:hypothetical protein
MAIRCLARYPSKWTCGSPEKARRHNEREPRRLFPPDEETDVVDEIRRSWADCRFIGMPAPPAQSSPKYTRRAI